MIDRRWLPLNARRNGSVDGNNAGAPPRRRDDMMVEPFRVDPDGWIRLGDAPGMGYPLDEDRLAATRIA